MSDGTLAIVRKFLSISVKYVLPEGHFSHFSFGKSSEVQALKHTVVHATQLARE